MKIRGNTVGTTLKPERAVVAATNLTPEQQKKARKNIGAIGNGEHINMGGKSITYANQILFANSTEDGNHVKMSKTVTSDGDVAFFVTQPLNSAPVLFRGVAAGKNDTDAVNKKQLDEAVAKNGGGAAMIVTVTDGVPNKTNEEIVAHIKSGGVAYLDVDSCRIPIYVVGGQSPMASFLDETNSFWVYEIFDDDVAETEHRLVEREQIEEINEQLGDIDTALDSIIAIQNSLIGGDA